VVERHARDLAQLARDTRAVSFEALEDADKQRLLGRVREFPRIVSEQHPETAVLRASVLPSTVVGACERLSAIAAQHGLKCATLVRAGNTAYCVLHASGAEAVARLAVALRALMDPAAGISRFTIEQCPATWKHAVNVWGPVREDFALMQRLKQVFDPHGILSPGRFVGGL
jgi:glycolate oxidase FAD binding subunit